MGAARIHLVAQVPALQGGAAFARFAAGCLGTGGAQVGHDDRGHEVAVLEQLLLHALQRDLAPAQHFGDFGQACAGAGARQAGVAHQGRDAFELLRRVGVEKAVVAVVHPVGAQGDGHALNGDQPRHGRAAVLLPGAVGPRAIEHHQPGGHAQRGGGLAGRAAFELCRVHIGHHAHVGVQHAAVAVCGQGVDPGQAQACVRLAHVLHRAGARKGQGGVHHAGVADVGVAQGIGGLGVPGQARAWNDHQRPPAGGPQRAPGDGARCHLLGLAVHQVGGGVTLGQLQLVQREALAGGHGVRPGHVLVEADGHHGVGANARAHHIDLARNGEVQLVEAVGPAPRKVRVAQQHAAAVGGHLLAKGPGIGAQGRVEQAQLAHGLGGVGQVHRLGAGLRGLG